MQITLKPFELDIELPNERDVIELASAAISSNVKRRLSQGRGANGSLPSPKDGGHALDRTGQLKNSIGYVMREKTAKGGKVVHWGVVRALGDRSDRATRDASSKARTKKLRAAHVIGVTMSELSSGKQSAKRGKRGNILVSSIRARSASTNGALVAILAQPPKDKRSVNGHRATYILFEENEDDMRTLKAVCQSNGKWRLNIKSR